MAFFTDKKFIHTFFGTSLIKCKTMTLTLCTFWILVFQKTIKNNCGQYWIYHWIDPPLEKVFIITNSEYLLCDPRILCNFWLEIFCVISKHDTFSITLFTRVLPSSTGNSPTSVFVGLGCQVSKRHCINCIYHIVV